MVFAMVGDILKKGRIIPFEQGAEICFRSGLKYADRRQFDKALKYFNKAVQIEPFNADYQFNLATVYAELQDIRKSNEILMGILVNINPALTECYFAMGCNYFDLQDMKKARECFEKYVYHDPEGIFADDAYDILYYLKFYDGAQGRRRKGKNSSRLAREGKKLLDDLKFDEAYNKLEKALEEDLGSVDARNDLAVLCFLNGDIERAISLEKSALILQRDNPFSLCNLAVLYSYKGDEEKLNYQLDSLTYSPVDFRKQLREIEEMYKKLCEVAKAVDMRRLTDSIGRISEEMEKKSIKWEKEWDDVIECAVQNRETIYRAGYEKELRSIWMNYIRRIDPDTAPVIRKREVWAAVLEYVYCRRHLIRVSKSSLAKKYSVSPSSISYRLKDFGI